MNIFVTGGTGFVGAHIVTALLQNGDHVTLLARNPDKLPALHHPNLTTLKGELKELEPQTLQGHEVCIHNAIIWEDDPTEDTRLSLKLFQAAASAGVGQILYTSSTAVHRPFQPLMDETQRLTPQDDYGAAKAASELFLSAISHQTNTRCNVIRLGPVIGTPAVDGGTTNCDRRFKEILTKAKSNEPIHIKNGEGRQFIGAKDAAKLFVALAHSNHNQETYLATSQNDTAWEEIAQGIIKRTDSKSPLILEDNSTPKTRFNISKIREQFGIAFDSTIAMSEYLDYAAAQSK